MQGTSATLFDHDTIEYLLTVARCPQQHDASRSLDATRSLGEDDTHGIRSPCSRDGDLLRNDERRP